MAFPKHIEWLQTRFSKRIKDKLAQQGASLDVHKALEIMTSADPTRKKIWTDWICKTWLEGGFLWEDIQVGQDSKVAETLQLFQEHNSKLSRNLRRINYHATLAKVWACIEPFSGLQNHGFTFDQLADSKIVASRKALKRDQKAQAFAESRIIYNSSELVVAAPLTLEASKWWGRGTRWCTAAEKNNVFNGYFEDGPIVVVSFKDVEDKLHKLQI